MSRSRRTKVPAEEKTRLVLAVLANEMTCAEAARRCGVTAVTMTKWKHQFLEGLVLIGSRRFPVGQRAGWEPLSSVGCGWRTSNSSWRWPKRRCSCGSGSAERPWLIRSLHRPRSPKGGSGAAGFEVRCPCRHPRTNLSAAAGQTANRRSSQGSMAGAGRRPHRSLGRQIRRGVAGVGLPQDRGHDAC
jgi:Transposase